MADIATRYGRQVLPFQDRLNESEHDGRNGENPIRCSSHGENHRCRNLSSSDGFTLTAVGAFMSRPGPEMPETQTYCGSQS